MKGTDLAPEGHVWQCQMCGRRSRTRYGFVDDGTPRGKDFLPDGQRVATVGWDESCSMNSVLCYEEPADGRLVAVIPQPEIELK